MRGVADAFDKALRGVKTLLKYNINITALLTLTSYNIDSVIPTLSFYKEIGLKMLRSCCFVQQEELKLIMRK